MLLGNNKDEFENIELLELEWHNFLKLWQWNNVWDQRCFLKFCAVYLNTDTDYSKHYLKRSEVQKSDI